jgi:predicted alpha/beta hydrolase
MGVRAGYYAPLADALAAHGFDALVVDHRGTGLRAARPPFDVGYRELVHEDVPRALAELETSFPGRPRYLLGHSLGGHIAALHLGLAPDACDALVLVASGAIDFRGYPFPGNLRILASVQLAAAITRTLGYFPGDKLGFGGRQPPTLIRDWARQCRTGTYRLSGSDEDYDARMGTVHKQVLAVSIAGDAWCPPEATKKLYGKLRRADVTHETVDAGVTRNAHLSWVKQPETVVSRIATFVGY